ncbi:Uncharacterised protein [uncultured archaeon]|nr:Uncharacterised protein [uncultured archaeon]
MERGDKSTIAILGAIAIVGVLALVTLVVQQPTGQVMQDQSIYVTEDAGNLAIECKNPTQTVVFLRYDANYAVYCCLEDMMDQNQCRFEKRVLLTRMY